MPYRNSSLTGLYLTALLLVSAGLQFLQVIPVGVQLLIEVVGLCALACITIYSFVRRTTVSAAEPQANQLVQPPDDKLDLHLRTIESLAIAIDAKDQTTHGHVRRTQVYATEMGKLLNVSRPEREALVAGAMLHDIGKLAVPDYILNKPGKLTDAEFAKMKVHPSVGADILKGVGFPFPVEDVVRYHHERWDGSGYPEGRKGLAIPLVARIIAVVDFYDSTRCDRPFRRGMTQQESLAMLTRMSGSGFDPLIVETFVQNVANFDKLIATEDLSEQVWASESGEGAEKIKDSRVDSLTSGESQTLALRSISAVQREVTALHDMLQTVGASLNLSDTLNLVGSKLAKLLLFDSAVIYLVDGEDGTASARSVRGANAEYFQNREIRQGEGISGWVIANGTKMSDAPADIELVGIPTEIKRSIARVMSSPLVSNGECFGAITLYGQRPGTFSSEEAELLGMVASHSAFAISNALTFEKTRDGALTDSLTQLPNARMFQMVIEQRLAQCRRSAREQLALLYINLDDFRSINECYGHSIGDRILGEVAELARNELRQMDMLTRHPGDQFIAIMPNASVAEARRAADRVRLAVESRNFPVRTGKTIELDLSFGVSSYPRSGETATELLAAANRDMEAYRSIRRGHGRNTAPVSVEAT